MHADVLVLGGGFAGVRCAQRLERLLPRSQRLTLVSSENHFVFQPLLPEVVGASLSPSHVTSPLRHLLRRTAIVRGTVTRIVFDPPGTTGGGGTAIGDTVAGTVTVAIEDMAEQIVFRPTHLVLALGSVVDASRIPGMAEHSMPMKNVADALALRHAVVTRLERAVVEPDAAERRALLTFVVVGGGFSGVETAAEIHDLVQAVRRFYPSLAAEQPRVVCVHARDRILPELDERLGAHALGVLTRRGVQFRLQERTRAASGEGVYLASGELLPTRTIVCTIGNAPHPVLQELGGDVDGRLRTDEFLHMLGHERVWALGDCACVPDGHGGIAPPTAQFAARQGDHCAANIAAALRGAPLRPFRHRSQGQLATLGHQNAVAAIGPFRITGFLAWWLWRTIYLLKLPRFDRKLRVVIDWTLNLFFPRDLNAFATTRTADQRLIHLEAGEQLFAQGDPSTAFYVVQSGCIELTRCGDDGTALGRERLGPGEHFGEGSLLRSGTRTTTAVATEPSTVLVFPAHEFSSLTRAFGGLRQLLEATSRRFQPAETILPAWVTPEQLAQPVAAVMTTPVTTLSRDATLQACLAQFLPCRFNSFPLVDECGRLVGLVTSSDLFAALRRDANLQQPLAAIATSRVHQVDAAAPVRQAVEIMRRRDVKHVVVTDGEQRVVGIVSIKDILALVVAAPTSAAAIGGG